MSSSSSTMSALPSPGPHANSSATEWGFEPLPSNVTFVNSTMNGTIINEKLYNGSDSSIITNGTTIVHTLDSNTIGSVSLVSFIYIIMSCIIIILMLLCGSCLNQFPTKRLYISSATHPSYSERDLKKELKELYPPPPGADLRPSYPELVSRSSNGTVSHEDIEWCKQLLRGKYALDCQVTALQYAYKPDAHVVDGLKARSVGAVQELRELARYWMRAKSQWTEEEFAVVKDICERIGRIGRH